MAQQESGEQPFLFDRSRLETYQRCPRRGYWNYLYKGRGVALQQRPLPLAFGGATHLGLQRLLETGDVGVAVTAALSEFEEQCRTRGLELNAREDQYSVFKEHAALLEALLRSWAIVRLPSFLAEYEVVDLEREEEYEIAPGIVLMARADGVLRQRGTGDLFVLSFKTTKQYGLWRDQEARTDIQGISELVAVESRTGERVQGIQMEYLVKGARQEWPRGSGIYQVNNPLIRPWFGPMGYAHSWDWDDADGHHTLGSKYRKVPIWEKMPIAEWIDKLASSEIQPEAGECLSKYVVSPLPYLRNRDEIESWKTQVVPQARQILVNKEIVEQDDTLQFHEKLDLFFPQYRHSCNYPTRCPYTDVCFGPCGPEPEESGKYVWREPHHEREVEALSAKENT